MTENGQLAINNVSKVFKLGGLLSNSKLAAVDDVSFNLGGEEPKVLSLVGESGSGKTTLSRMILGLVKPTSGQIYIKTLTFPEQRVNNCASFAKKSSRYSKTHLKPSTPSKKLIGTCRVPQ
jgi:peptide/nickel transport system ATP-binding protein